MRCEICNKKLTDKEIANNLIEIWWKKYLCSVCKRPDKMPQTILNKHIEKLEKEVAKMERMLFK